jgi:hypothetical protein
MKCFNIVTVVAAAFLSGCDPMYGVQTSLDLRGPFDAACVDRAIKSTAGVGNVEFQRKQFDNMEIAPHWGRLVETVTYWSYGSNGEHAIFQVHESRENSEVENGMTSLGQKISAERINTYVPLMQSIDKNVERMCGIPLSSKGVTRTRIWP